MSKEEYADLYKNEEYNQPGFARFIRLIFILIVVGLAVLLLSCEKQTECNLLGTYRGTITYNLPTYHQTTQASRIITAYDGEIIKIRWWESRDVNCYTIPEGNQYPICNVIIPSTPSCADSVFLSHSGIGILHGDSLIESGTVHYIKWISGELVTDETGSWICRLKRQ